MRKYISLLAILALLIAPSTVFAKGGISSSGGGSRSAPSGGGGKSYSGGGGSKSSGSSKSTGSSGKPTTASKPSSGPKTQKPVTRILPKTPPPRIVTPAVGRKAPVVRVPAGRNYGRDYQTVANKPYSHNGRQYYHTDPYGPRYYGYHSDFNPFFYMWMFGMMDNDTSNNPLPPEAQEGQVASIIPSYLAIAQAIVEGAR